MNNPETVSEAYVKWLEDQNIATFNVDLFLNQVNDKAPDTCYWVKTSGGNTVRVLATGEKVKQYAIETDYRSMSGKEVERKLFALEELLNTPGCFELEGFEVYNISASQYPNDADLDNEDRRQGFVLANIQIYKKG